MRNSHWLESSYTSGGPFVHWLYMWQKKSQSIESNWNTVIAEMHSCQERAASHVFNSCISYMWRDALSTGLEYQILCLQCIFENSSPYLLNIIWSSVLFIVNILHLHFHIQYSYCGYLFPLTNWSRWLQPLLSCDLLSNKTMATEERVLIFIGWAISIFHMSPPGILFIRLPCASICVWRVQWQVYNLCCPRTLFCPTKQVIEVMFLNIWVAFIVSSLWLHYFFTIDREMESSLPKVQINTVTCHTCALSQVYRAIFR